MADRSKIQQDLTHAQDMLTTWQATELSLAGTPAAAVGFEGRSTTLKTPAQVREQVLYWTNRVTLLTNQLNGQSRAARVVAGW